MLLPQPLSRGRLLRRYKRFLADIAFDDGDEETVHTPNPGAMLGLAAPGMTVWTSTARSPTRKLARTWELVQADGALVGVNTMVANRLVAEALAQNRIPELAGYPEAQREVSYADHGRADFRLRAPERAPVWLEVKSVTLGRTPGLAEWPDCPSTRASRHLHALAARAAAGERAVVLFVVQRADCDHFALAADLDPAFATALDRALSVGVELLCYGCDLSQASITIARRLRWDGRGCPVP